MNEHNPHLFYALVFCLMDWPDCPGSAEPAWCIRDDGCDGDRYLSWGEHERVALTVARLVPGIQRADWWDDRGGPEATLQRRLEFLTAALQAKGGADGAASERPNCDPPILACVADLARCLGQPTGGVETFLRRYRKEHPDCFREVDNPRKNEARYVYRTSDVWPALQEWAAKGAKLTDG